MKILYTNIHPRNGGGHVTYIRHLAGALAAAHDITVGTPGTSRLHAQASALPGVRTIDMCFTSRLPAMLREVAALRALIRRERFDIVHVNASGDHRHAMLACLGLRDAPRIVWTKHNDHRLSSVGHRLRARFGTQQAIAVSDYVAGLIRQSPYRDVPLHVVRHGVDTAVFAPVPAARRQAMRRALLGELADGRVVLGSSGGTDFEKGWLDLAQGMALLPPEQRARLLVVMAGDPPNARRREALQATGVAAQFVFPGLLDDVRDMLAACDLGFVLSHREALSFACRETMALGLPTLVSDAGGLPENVSHGRDGWVVPVRNPAAIADVLGRILADPDGLAPMALAARNTAEQDFSLDRFVRSTLAVYDDALAGRAPRAGKATA